MNVAACSWIAATTFGWQWPVLGTAMPLVKSRYSVPSVVVTVQPEPEATWSSVTRNQTSARFFTDHPGDENRSIRAGKRQAKATTGKRAAIYTRISDDRDASACAGRRSVPS